MIWYDIVIRMHGLISSWYHHHVISDVQVRYMKPLNAQTRIASKPLHAYHRFDAMARQAILTTVDGR